MSQIQCYRKECMGEEVSGLECQIGGVKIKGEELGGCWASYQISAQKFERVAMLWWAYYYKMGLGPKKGEQVKASFRS